MQIKISDSFMYFNEGAVCLLRLHYLCNVVDSFVVIEGTHTFTGQARKLRFHDRIMADLHGYPDLIKKIRYVPVDLSDVVKINDPWQVESFLRCSIAKHVDPGTDVTICSDCDEIPSIKWIADIRAAVARLRSDSSFDCQLSSTIFASSMFMFYGNARNLMFDNTFSPVKWRGPFAVINHTLRLNNADLLRIAISTGQVPEMANNSKADVVVSQNGGWHLSYFGDPKDVDDKIASFSHQEYSIQAHKSHAHASTEMGQDPFMRDYHFRLPMPEELFPRPNQDQKLSEKLGYPDLDNAYLQVACTQRTLENSFRSLQSLAGMMDQLRSADIARSEADYARSEAQQARIEAEKAKHEAEKAKHEAQQARSQAEKANANADEARTEALRVQQDLNAIRQSLFWRMTKPVRRILRAFR